MKRIFFSFFLFIMIGMIGLQFAQPLLISKPLQEYYRQAYLDYWRDLTRGTFHLLLNELEPLSPAEQQERLQQLQSRFGYPITLSDSDQLTLSPLEQEQLNSLLIVVKNNGSLFYRLIPASNKVITMGPINDLDLSLQIDLLAWAMITLLFGLMAILWARPLWLKLKEISRAAQAFGQGTSLLAPICRTARHWPRWRKLLTTWPGEYSS